MNRDRVRDQVRRSRLAQGLPEHIGADRLLDELAREVLDDGGRLAMLADPSRERIAPRGDAPAA
jgi:hypothetical protein